jgi:hypothetical protein
VVTATDLGDGLTVRCRHCSVVHEVDRECTHCRDRHDLDAWLGREISCPNPACRARIRVNAFTAGGDRTRQRPSGPARRSSADVGGADLGQWLQAHHPDVFEDLLMGIVAGDPGRIEALRSPDRLEKWVKRHHRGTYRQWKDR